jgi:hypothetical protein
MKLKTRLTISVIAMMVALITIDEISSKQNRETIDLLVHELSRFKLNKFGGIL